MDWFSRNYLLSQPENIRIYNFVNLYTKKVDGFNQWLNREIKDYHKKDLDELNLLRKRYREISKTFT